MKIIFKKTPWFTVIMTLCLLTATLFATSGCGKEKEPKIVHLKTELGGCNLGISDLKRDDEDNTVIITISEDVVNVFVGIKFQCKIDPFETQIETIDDVLFMHIKDICEDNEKNCYERCSCYYTFDFVFNYQGIINQKYKILLHQTYPFYGEEPIIIISEGIITNNN